MIPAIRVISSRDAIWAAHFLTVFRRRWAKPVAYAFFLMVGTYYFLRQTVGPRLLRIAGTIRSHWRLLHRLPLRVRGDRAAKAFVALFVTQMGELVESAQSLLVERGLLEYSYNDPIGRQLSPEDMAALLLLSHGAYALLHLH